MATSRNRFTFKIILSYLVLGALSVVVGFFLFAEFEKLTTENVVNSGEKKFVETGTLINLVYKTDGYSRLALLTESDDDFETYLAKNDSLFAKIEDIKSLTTNEFQRQQLDSVKSLLHEKNRNIEQLRILRLTNQKEATLDDIMKEVRKLEASVGLNSVESMVRNPSKLTPRERKVWQSYADYLNRDSQREIISVKSKTVDSMLIASRYIVAEAKKENSRIRQSLMQKENELILNDLNISERLREIIVSFDAEITRNINIENQLRTDSISRTGQVLKFAGILGGIVILIFSYFILSDFFKAERFKQYLEESKNYAETLLKSREQLISTVSHDLKTPLNTISGYSELFKNSNLSEKQKHYLRQITSSSHFITHLVDDLLDYSKLEAGKLHVDNIPFSLENIITEAGNAVKQLYPLKPVDLKIEISNSIQGAIFESDPLRIRQIINNLAGNAFKFTESGSVLIEVKELETNDHVSEIEISIIDTGIGISQEKQEIIFNEFTQAETDIAHKFGGSGLGLAISKKLTQLLNGSLSVKSSLGSGSHFTLTLPLKKSKRFLSKVSSKKQEAFSRLKALIIDDDQAMRTMLKETFEQMEIETQVFESFESLIDFTKSKGANLEFDFVLTDIQMPTIDGFEVLRNLKKGKINSYKNQAVIAMTGNRDHDREFYYEKGFTDMLNKPFSKQELIEVLTSIFPSRDYSKVEKTHLKSSENRETFNLSLLKSFLNTPESLAEVLNIFKYQTEVDLKRIKEAIVLNDIETIKQTSHRMLTMFRQLKAAEVIPILEKMEAYSEGNTELSTIESDYKELELKSEVLLKALSYQ